MDEMSHTDPALAVRGDRKAMQRGEDEKKALRALVERGNWQKLADDCSTDRPAASDENPDRDQTPLPQAE
jgi:hypothetical protein